MENTEKESIKNYKPAKKFIDGLGKRIVDYIGEDDACVLALGDDGFFYGKGLYEWLKEKNLPVIFTAADQDLSDLDKEALIKRKVLVVDNDIITGVSYKKAMDYLRKLLSPLKIKDLKYAVMRDKMRLADFSVEGHSSSLGDKMIRMDATDFKIIQMMTENGRLTFADIGKEVGLTVSGAKKRVDRLIKKRVIEVKARMNMGKFYSMSAVIRAEVASGNLPGFIEKIKKSPLIFTIIRLFDSYNVMIGIAASRPIHIDEFIKKYISDEPGVHGFTVQIGDIPVAPDSK